MRIDSKEKLLELCGAEQQKLAACDCRILVCSGTGCIATGSHKIYEKFLEVAKDAPGVSIAFAPHDEDEKQVGIKKTGCQGVCELGPLVRIQKGDKVVQYTKVQPEDCEELFERTVLGDEVLEHLLYKKAGKSYVEPDDIPFIAKQTRIVLKNCGKFDAESLGEYIASGGFAALSKALFEMSTSDPASVDEGAEDSRQERNGSRWRANRRRSVMSYVMATRAIRVRLWMALSWKATRSD